MSSQWPKCPLNALYEFRNGLKTKRKLPQAMRIESTHLVNIKEFCGAAWSSKELKVMRGNFACPLNAPKKFALLSSSFNIYDPNIHVMAANPAALIVGHKGD